MGFGPTLFARRSGETDVPARPGFPFGGYVKMAGKKRRRGTADRPGHGVFRQTAASSAPRSSRRARRVNLVFAFVVLFAAYFALRRSGAVERRPRSAVWLRGQLAADKSGPAARRDGAVGRRRDRRRLGDFSPSASARATGRTLTLTFCATAPGPSVKSASHRRSRPIRTISAKSSARAYMIGIQREFEPEKVGLFESLGARCRRLDVAHVGDDLHDARSHDPGPGLRFRSRRPDHDRAGGRPLGRAGLEPLLRFIALISVNLGILNILPIPVLDGGHLFFFLSRPFVAGRCPCAIARWRSRSACCCSSR